MAGLFRRLLAPAVLLLVVRLDGVSAERLRLSGAFRLRPAMRARSMEERTSSSASSSRGPSAWRARLLDVWPRALVPSGILLATVASATPIAPFALQSSHDTADLFAKMDIDRDMRISQREYDVYLQRHEDEDGIEEFLYEARAIFIQADVDDDAHLAMPEFEFARYLIEEKDLDIVLRALAARLPPGFLEKLRETFDVLRTKSGGKVSLEEVMQALLELRGGKAAEDVSASRVEELFNHADIITDGMLNLNELDFFEFMLRDVLVEALVKVDQTVHMHVEGGGENAEEEVRRALVEAFFKVYDTDRNGQLGRAEIVEGLRTTVEEAAEFRDPTALEAEIKAYLDFVSDGFETADSDADGQLTEEEALALMDHLTTWGSA